MTQWIDFWNTSSQYHAEKLSSYNIVDKYLTTPPTTILDIGCGFAFESRLFNKNYNTQLWLLDGDVSSNQGTKREIKFGPVETMGFYNKLSDIKQVLDEDLITDYQLIDANRIEIPDTQKFDLICSWFSCGFHYPISVYKELILAHSHKDTQLIFDLRKKNLDTNEVTIVKILEEGEKHIKAVVKF